jgi:hypothetical protein
MHPAACIRQAKGPVSRCCEKNLIGHANTETSLVENALGAHATTLHNQCSVHRTRAIHRWADGRHLRMTTQTFRAHQVDSVLEAVAKSTKICSPWSEDDRSTDLHLSSEIMKGSTWR